MVGSIKSDAFKSSKIPKKYAKKQYNNETQRGDGEQGYKGRRWTKNKKASARSNTSTVIAVGAENTAEEKTADNASITIAIPVSQQVANTASTPQNAPP